MQSQTVSSHPEITLSSYKPSTWDTVVRYNWCEVRYGSSVLCFLCQIVDPHRALRMEAALSFQGFNPQSPDASHARSGNFSNPVKCPYDIRWMPGFVAKDHKLHRSIEMTRNGVLSSLDLGSVLAQLEYLLMVSIGGNRFSACGTDGCETAVLVGIQFEGTTGKWDKYQTCNPVHLSVYHDPLLYPALTSSDSAVMSLDLQVKFDGILTKLVSPNAIRWSATMHGNQAGLYTKNFQFTTV